VSEIIQLGDITVYVARKAIKNVRLVVHPPDGRVTMTAPLTIHHEILRTHAASKINWIARNQEKMRSLRREPPRAYVSRETHFVWGHRYLLEVVEQDNKPFVRIEPGRILMFVRPGTGLEKRAEVFHTWQRSLLHEFLPPLISKWEQKLGVKVSAYFLQKMKTKWGSCNYRSARIRLNTDLVAKPKELVEYVLVHEMAHLLVPNHGPQFVAILDKHLPFWRDSRRELNQFSLASSA